MWRAAALALAALLFTIPECEPAPAGAQVYTPIRFSLTPSNLTSAVFSMLPGDSTCDVVVGTSTTGNVGSTLTPQVTSEGVNAIANGTAIWATVSTINSGSVPGSSSGQYTGSVAAFGLTGFEVVASGLTSGSINGSIFCSPANIPGSGGGGGGGGSVTQGTVPWVVSGQGTAGSPAPGVVTIQGIAGGVAQPVSGTVSLGAGTAAIGSITNTSFAATQSGPWNVGLTGTLPAYATTPTFNCGTGCYQTTQPVSGTVSLGAGTASIGSISNTSFFATNPYTSGGPTAVQSGDTLGIGCEYLSSITNATSGQFQPCKVDAAGDIHVGLYSAGGTVINSNSGSADAISSTFAGLQTSTFMFGYNGSSFDRIRTATVGNGVAATGLLASAPYGEYLTTAPTLTNAQYSDLMVDSSGRLLISPTGLPTPLATQPVSGTVTVNTPAPCTAATCTSLTAGQGQQGTYNVPMLDEPPTYSSNITTTGTTQIIAGSATLNTYVYGVWVENTAANTSTQALALEGTGATCSGSTVNLNVQPRTLGAATLDVTTLVGGFGGTQGGVNMEYVPLSSPYIIPAAATPVNVCVTISAGTTIAVKLIAWSIQRAN